MKRFFAGVCLWLISGSPAYAEFTPLEKDHIVNQLAAMHMLTSAGDSLVHFAITNRGQTQESSQVMNTMIGGRSGALLAHFEAVALLADFGPKIGTNGTRAETVELAIARLDVARQSYLRAFSELDSLIATCDSSCPNLINARSYLQSAFERLELFDSGLGYWAPRPAGTMSGASLTTAGGTEDLSVAFEDLGDELAAAHHHTSVAWSRALAAVSNYRSRGALRGMLSASSEYRTILQTIHAALAVLINADIPWIVGGSQPFLAKKPEGDETSFPIELLRGMLLNRDPQNIERTSGLLERYYTVCVEKSQALVKDPRAPVHIRQIGDELRSVCDAWRATNRAGWFVNVVRYLATDETRAEASGPMLLAGATATNSASGSSTDLPEMETNNGASAFESDETAKMAQLSTETQATSSSGDDVAWLEIPSSSMETVYKPEVDGPLMRFRNIQNAWGGATCAGGELYIWGGGHGDSSHNGLFKVNPTTGVWTRVTEPSQQQWTEDMCPGGICNSPYGPCRFGKCNALPDGNPASHHTYYNITSDDRFIYNVGGSVYPMGTAGDPPTGWKFDLDTKKWSPIAERPIRRSGGNLIRVGTSLYYTTANGYAIYDSRLDRWMRLGGSGVPVQTGIVAAGTRFFALGNGWSHYTSMADWGEPMKEFQRPDDPVLEENYPGLTYYEPEKLILLWRGGARILTLDATTLEWGQVIPSGNPGVLNTVGGTFGRLSYCGGRVILVNGTDQNVHYLEIPSGGLEPETVLVPPPPPEPEPEPQSEPATCGDGILNQRWEQCEADGELNGKTCADFSSFTGGVLRCTAPSSSSQGCQYETSLCTAEPAPTPPSDRSEPPQPDDPEPGTIPDPNLVPARHFAPYYASPPGDTLVEQDCGPISDWTVVDITTNEQASRMRRDHIESDSTIVFRMHWKLMPYPVLDVKYGKCIKVVGVDGPSGQKTLVAKVNATQSGKARRRAGGLIIENLIVSQGKALKADPSIHFGSGDCIGTPDNRNFVIVRDSEVSQCTHHALLTGPTSKWMYVEIGRSTFQEGGSHLVYVDQAAMLYVYDSLFQSSGWGNALRCIALRCIVERTRLSNVQFDGTVLCGSQATDTRCSDVSDRPFNRDKVYIGDAPLEIYACGEHEVRDVDIVYYTEGGLFAANLRRREFFGGCNVGDHEGHYWERLYPWDSAHLDPATWSNITTELPLTVDGMTIECIGPRTCRGWKLDSPYPVMGREQDEAFLAWLASVAPSSWEDLVAAAEVSGNPHWQFLVSATIPSYRDQLLRGRLRNHVPMAVPETWWQRSVFRHRNIQLDGNINGLIQPVPPPDKYCYGVPWDNRLGCVEQDNGKSYDQARIEPF